MKLTDRQQKIVDVVQWILIVFLLITCAVVFIGNKHLKREKEIIKEDTYIKIYESQKIAELEKKNKALYDSLMLKSEKQPESAVEIRYKYKYKTDTVKVTEFVMSDDSIYHYTNDNDTIKTDINIKAKDLEWCNVNAVINDKFTIINRVDGNEVETTINHSPNVEITNVDAWHVKTTWKDRIGYGPSVGLGYGVINKKPDVFIGFTVTYDISKKKRRIK